MTGQRVLSLDALRGFALLGILFGNLTWFTGWAVLDGEARAGLATRDLDTAATWAIHFLVDGKFYGIFSLLFGAGIAIVIERAQARGHPVAPVLLRRFAVLLIIGLAHAVLLWFGDIVSLYAVIGTALLLFVNVEVRTLLVAAGCLFAVPVALAALWWGAGVAPPPYGPYELLPRFGDGTYGETFVANWEFLVGRWEQAIHSGRPCKLLGLFLLGAWAVRRGLALEPGKHVALLRRLLGAGLAIGIPANVGLAIIKSTPGTPALAFLHAVVDTVAVPSLAAAYSAALLLVLERPRARARLEWLAAPGRMTLTHYLMQSVIGIAVFYGYGAGQWGRLGAVWIVPLAFAIFLLQGAFSTLWLRRFRQGPLEWLWRRVSEVARPTAA